MQPTTKRLYTFKKEITQRYKKQPLRKSSSKLYLASRDPGAVTDETAHCLLADVESRLGDLGLVGLLHDDRGEHAHDDLLLLIGLGQGMVEGVQISGSDER